MAQWPTVVQRRTGGKVYSASEDGDVVVEVEIERASGLGLIDDTTHEGLAKGESTGWIMQARVDVPAAGSP